MQPDLQGMHGSAYLGKNGVASIPLVVLTLRSRALPASNLQTLSPRHESQVISTQRSRSPCMIIYVPQSMRQDVPTCKFVSKSLIVSYVSVHQRTYF